MAGSHHHLIAMAFATGILLTDQFARLTTLTITTFPTTHPTEFEFLPLELIRAMNNGTDTTTYATTALDDEINDDDMNDDKETQETTTTKKKVAAGGFKVKKFPWSLPSPPLHPKTSKQFMSELNALKRQHNISLPWETSTPLPLPIISYNLPKSATLTTKEFFACGNIISSHTFIPHGKIRVGDCMRDNFVSNRDPFHKCDIHLKYKKKIEFYSDLGIQIGASGKSCWYNSLHDGGLEHVARYYPNSTIFMVPRNASSWYNSVRKWGNGRLLQGWKKRCNFTGSLGDYSQADWESFYHAHTEKIRQFAMNNLHITYVEVELETEDAAETMEYYTGIDRGCLQHCFPGPPKDPNVDLKTYKKCKPMNATAR